MRVAVAMSGGVDSGVSALLLKEQGLEAVGLFMSTGLEGEDPTACRSRACCSEADAEDAFLALAEVGDDFQAEAAGAQIDPETWDHGSADQRTFWLATGLDAGAADQDPLTACDTYTILEP